MARRIIFWINGINIHVREVYTFQPARKIGYLFHAAVILAFSALGMLGLWQASQAEIGPVFLATLLPALVAIVLVPLMGYSLFALRGARYILERDGIRLHWGLRGEDIPMDKVLWIRPASQLEAPLPLPWFRWPGKVTGMRHLPGEVILEYFTSQAGNPLLIATPGQVFAISPENPAEFLRVYQRFMELGCLTPIPARSFHPNFLLARFWSDRPARYLLLGGAALNLVLLAWVSLAIPGREQIPLRLAVGNIPLELAPSVRLLLLPVLNACFFIADLLLGLVFYRQDERRSLAYLLLGSGVVTPVLFLLATSFILAAS